MSSLSGPVSGMRQGGSRADLGVWDAWSTLWAPRRSGMSEMGQGDRPSRAIRVPHHGSLQGNMLQGMTMG